MATLKERLSEQLQGMVSERNSLDEQIKQMRSFIAGIDSNGASRPSRRQTGRRRTARPRAPQVSGEERARQILEFMGKSKEPVTSKEIGEHLGVTTNVARKHIDALIKSKGIKEAGVRPRDPNARGGRESKLYALG